MKFTLIAFIFSLALSCGSSPKSSDTETISTTEKNTSTDSIKINTNFILDSTNNLANEYGQKISQENLKKILHVLASDEYFGRRTGEIGQKKAAEFISNYYKNLGVAAADLNGNYLQTIPKTYFKGSTQNNSENIVAYIKGSEKPDEYIILSAHYDHLGIKGDKIYNGADDDASGTSAVIEIAKAFQSAVKTGNGPKRSIVFLHVTGEELGLYGSKYYTENPIFPLEKTVANLNIDMIGRFDEKHAENPEFVYLIGSDKLSSELHELSEATNKKYTQLELDYTYNAENDPNRFYYRSDHYNFAKNNIPVIFYFNGVHEDYHKPSDTADKIRFDLLQKRTQLVFYTAWEIANRDKKLVVDK
ncbi:M28 family peptidase [Aureibaculum marinum]|uniref:M28 family peptidase n=2 Tax=Pseudomonadati TaxID=3379134 RepID=A0A3N4N5Z1_9FLAO|nr:M28 family metallopeptidase [Aureibaculum marinum]RPD90775.1 M28 family peptidase [Aureibaculum marinum]